MGYRIAEVRKKKKISQTELAKKSGVSRATISGLESGRVTVTTSATLSKIAIALDATIGDIFFSQVV